MNEMLREFEESGDLEIAAELLNRKIKSELRRIKSMLRGNLELDHSFTMNSMKPLEQPKQEKLLDLMECTSKS